MVKALAEAGSLTGAAHELGMTHQALSRQLRELERRLGVSLATRTGRSTVLTPAGQLLAQRATRILLELHRTEMDVRSLDGTVTQAGRDPLTRLGGKRYVADGADPWRIYQTDVQVDLKWQAGKIPFTDISLATRTVTRNFKFELWAEQAGPWGKLYAN
ncbi:LysR family transcriptional regulator [Micromonospora halophytica]|uniref:LysR family transcriptional regulator n=1 Tax=Micromonospora halophytica TaxID=47864 RepID=UPI001B8CDAF5|nr:LysR family transcriptional regulator [Micromonospora halophytica]